MNSKFLAAVAAVVLVGQAYAVDAIYTSGTRTVQVPVTSYVEEPRQYTVTRMVPTSRTIQVPQRRAVTERVQVPCTRTEYVNETYTATETRYEMRPETRTRRRATYVMEQRPRRVTRRVCEEVYDPATCSYRTVNRRVCETEMVPVRRRVYVNEPYTVNVRHRVCVPVTKTRRVARRVPSVREEVRTRYVTEMVPQTVTEMQPVSQVMGYTVRRPVCTMQTMQVPAPVVTPTCTTNVCGL